jgi:hypothetical protein
MLSISGPSRVQINLYVMEVIRQSSTSQLHHPVVQELFLINGIFKMA